MTTLIHPPESVKDRSLKINVFCPTGPGGGIDPTCSPGGSRGPSVSFKGFGTKDVEWDAQRVESRKLQLEDARKVMPELDRMIADNPGLRDIPGALDVSVSVQRADLVKNPKTGSLVHGYYVRSEHRIGLAYSNYRPLEGDLTIGDHKVDNSRMGTLRHEFGHHLHNSLGEKDRKRWQEIYDSIEDKVGSLSEYGSYRSSEGFAEAFSSYTHKGYGFKGKRLPESVTNYMADLLEGEYVGEE